MRSQDRPRRQRRLPSAELRSGAAVPRLRIDCFLAGLLITVGLAQFFGAAGASWEVSATFAALSLKDALLTGVGLLIAAMTGVVGALVVADARADVAAARAWQDINAELAVVGTVAETAPVVRIEARYTAAAQDEGLRRILLAHRFIVPVPFFSDSGSAAPSRVGAVTIGEPDGVRSGTALQMSDRPAIDGHRAHMAANSEVAIDCTSQLSASNVKDWGRRGQRSAIRRVSRALLVANAGVRWDGPVRSAVDACRAPADACPADVIVLADRSSRDGNPAHRDVSAVPRTTAQPGCRGPPVGVSQQQVSSGPGTIGKSFRENVQSRANAPADPAVVDNLGDNVPVGAAELEVIEAYLDNVLGELLAAVASGQNRGKS